jgi:hypothetical protein
VRQAAPYYPDGISKHIGDIARKQLGPPASSQISGLEDDMPGLLSKGRFTIENEDSDAERTLIFDALTHSSSLDREPPLRHHADTSLRASSSTGVTEEVRTQSPTVISDSDQELADFILLTTATRRPEYKISNHEVDSVLEAIHTSQTERHEILKLKGTKAAALVDALQKVYIQGINKSLSIPG